MNTTTRDKPILEKLEPYMGYLGPMAMIVLILAFMGVMEPARYFRLSNMNQILLDAALYMPMAMAMTFVMFGSVNLRADSPAQPSKRRITGYSKLKAKSMAGAKKLLNGHPHLTWARGCEIEVHEVKPMG